ncbi:MAG: hypothetical protein OEV42_15145 [Deltaproteobacteria bacterium]|nr:hypothetical protein [Deltaproteobacteria bacterium]
MSESAIRTEIKGILDGVTGIGIVHDYQRWAANRGKFIDFFKDTGTGAIFGWEITRTGAKIDKVSRNYNVTHHFLLKGYYAVKDAAESEKLFNAVIESIVSTLVNATITGTQGTATPQVPLIERRPVNGIQCHYGEIKLDVSEIIEPDAEAADDLLKIGLEYYLQDPDDDGTADANDEITL